MACWDPPDHHVSQPTPSPSRSACQVWPDRHGGAVGVKRAAGAVGVKRAAGAVGVKRAAGLFAKRWTLRRIGARRPLE